MSSAGDWFRHVWQEDQGDGEECTATCGSDVTDI